MKRSLSVILCILLVISMLGACGNKAAEPQPAAESAAQPVSEAAPEAPQEPEIPNTEGDHTYPDVVPEAIFRGVENYGKVDASEIKAKGKDCYLFEFDGEVHNLAIRYKLGYEIQNQLMEGYRYSLSLDGNTVNDVELLDEMTEYEPVIQAEPGLKTLKNFLATCFEPMGTALYVYGGNWDWQDEGSSIWATHIGVPGPWVDFYQSQDAHYAYADDYHPTISYYPYGGWNEYFYAGTDCSGYAGWAVYNTLNTEDGHEGYVMGASRQGRVFAENYHLGEWTKDPFDTEEDPLQPGDMISTPTHIWICVGKCDDGSIVAIHSTVTRSATGNDGGGVQLSAVNPNGYKKDCEAYRLACEYTEKYFPDWYSRYPIVMKGYEKYVDFDRQYDNPGRFRWSLDGTTGLSDPDNYASMTAAEVLADLFGE